MPHLDSIITKISTGSYSDKEKGSLFELICLHFLRHDTYYSTQFTDAKLWHDFDGGPDIGIDIVATCTDNTRCAIQCKFRQDDSSITKAELDSFISASGKDKYKRRMLFTLTGDFSKNAQDMLDGQDPRVEIITRERLDRTIDWTNYPEKTSIVHKELRDHQVRAINDVLEGFSHHSRGRLIMACGTGKTFTSLKIAEAIAGKSGLVLVLVPSISLLNQSLLAWNYDHDENIPLTSFAVCSDSTVGRKDYPDEDLRLSDLEIPATTNANDLITSFTPNSEAMTVIFSTYQSLEVINEAQQKGLPDFDLIICDEAHRTAGISLKDKQDSNFRRVHDDNFIHSRKRLYMTATPRVFGDSASEQAQAQDILLCSMDNEELYGPEFHRLSFSKAVTEGLLADYKVMIFMVEKSSENEPDFTAMIQGVSKALAKEISPVDMDFLENDTEPMHKAVAFSNTIAKSIDFAKGMAALSTCEVRHIDGKTPASKRSASLLWLKASGENCRILTNARCLCEGVDVPALDAVVFLNPKSSEIDIVQSVGRVMRKSPDKTYGYVILPVIVNPDETPEYALDHNESYRTVWKVLQALRAHDDHFNIEINSLSINKGSKKVRPVGGKRSRKSWFTDALEERYRQEIYIRMVRKCGDREYWEAWIRDFANAFTEIRERIKQALSAKEVKNEFGNFTGELRALINDSVTPEQAIEMLAQHITSKEIFDALFSGFSDNNPISQSMQNMRRFLENQGFNLDPTGIKTFNERVKDKARAAQTGEAKQKLLRDIYNNFFRHAFEETAKQLGIVYTPEEIVDFILKSADWAVREKLGHPQGLASENVHILDPFSGTGTFTARLLGLGLIPRESLERKYLREIHANEILLLAYYISAINIEAEYNQQTGGLYSEFRGMVFADTFNLNKDRTQYIHRIFYENGERAAKQEDTSITVIVSNPPYSVGGTKGYDVDKSIKSTYADASNATNKGSLYDSYIRAIRWATDRIGNNSGVVCFVSNGSFIDSRSADGMRKCLAEDFSDIYIFNLRGNQRGDWRREGEKVFGEGSQCPIAVTLFVRDKRRKPGQCGIHYYAVGDGMTREGKLKELAESESFGAMESCGKLSRLVPDEWGDWIGQVSEEYKGFICLGNKNERERAAIFEERYSAGVETGRDAWCVNFSRQALCENVKKLLRSVASRDEGISWSREIRKIAGEAISFSDDAVRVSLYRPYTKEYLYFSSEIDDYVFQMPKFFPKSDSQNMVICVSGIGSKNFSVLMTNCLPSRHLIGASQCFPLFWYEDVDSVLFGSRLERRDGVSDETCTLFRLHYGDGGITKEDIFCYLYGVLSSREYAERFGGDAGRKLARVPLAGDFWAFRNAGRELGGLHVGYESVEEWPLDVEYDGGRITKLRADVKSGEIFGRGLRVRGIPESAWGYRVNGRSALEWVVERYRDDVDGKTGIRNDCNAWGGGEYVLSLIRRVTTVSVRTVEILGKMPELGV